MRSVHGISTSLVAFVFLITLTGAPARADEKAYIAPSSVADGETGILLLEDGGVLTGQITRAADWYVVARGGGEIQIARKRVLLVCHTLDEAYEFRRQRIHADQVADHLRLAEWCIRYHLGNEAGRELVEARHLDPDQPRLALLERRHEKMDEHAAAQEAVYLTRAVSKSKSQAAAAPKPAESAASPALHVGDLPNGVVEYFTRKVQPVLVNNCSLSGCHQTGSKLSFQLDRALLRGEANRRSTTRNLEAALALVDRAHPDQSPLLTVPRKSHGGTTGPIFGPRQQQAYGHLVDWIALISPPPEAPAAAAATDETANSIEATTAKANNEPVQTPAQAAPRLPQRRHAAVHVAASTDDDATMTLRTPHHLQVGVQPKSWQPRDAFDPEIFNRNQGARSQVSAESTATSATADATTAAAEQR